MKRVTVALAVLAATIGMSITASADEVTTLRLGHVNGAEDSVNQVAAEKLNELLAEKLPQYQVEIYPAGQLGGERDMIESVQMGTLDMVITATTPLANFVPSLNVVELLYLIQDFDHADAVFEGEIGNQWLEDCSAAGMKGLGFTEAGFRHLCYNQDPIESMDDLSGLKLRVMENDMHVNGWKTLGCDAVTMGWADAYAGVQQGTIDAVEVPYSLAYSNSVYDVCKYVSETSHIYTAQCMLMNGGVWDSISEEDQAVFQECAAEACAYSKEYIRKKTEEYKQMMIDKGVSVVEVNMDEFREAAKALYEEYEGEYGEAIAAIQALAE